MRFNCRLAALAGLLATLIAPQSLLAQKKLCVMNIDGTGLRTLSEMPGYAWQGSPNWSHDGKKIAFDATTGGFEQDHIFVVDAAGGEPRDIGLGSQPSWSADDKQLCFFTLPGNPAEEKVGVWVMNAEGQARQFVTTGTKGRWSNDGSRIAYIDEHDGAETIWLYNIVDAESKPLLQYKFAGLSPPVWSDDSQQIAFVGIRDGVESPQLCVINTERKGAPAVKIKEDLTFVSPCWAPAKNILVGMAGENGAKPRWLDPRKNDPPTAIDCNVANFGDPCWSPDGKQIAFYCDK
jgi:Tol biopolymer transport system component